MWVLPITPEVRQVLALFLNLYRNYAEAAEAVGIAKDTLARYCDGMPNMALYVFDRVAKVVEERASLEQRKEFLEGVDFEQLRSLAEPRNRAELDRRRYAITEGLQRLLSHYETHFPNRRRAAASLGINPRTFKAYTTGEVKTFPGRHLDMMLEILAQRGARGFDLLKIAGSSDWTDILKIKY